MLMKRLPFAAAAALLATAPAGAESVTMTGYFPAQARDASLLLRMAVDRFDGTDGPAMEAAVERALANQTVDGVPHFRIVAAGPGDSVAANGVLSGNANADVVTNRDVRKEEECVEKKDDKCVRKQQVEIVCRRRLIDFATDLRIVRTRDRAVVYSDRKTRHNEVSWCPKDSAPAGPEATIRGMIDDIANETARDITPHIDRYTVRFYESRDGMPKDVGQRFKDAIRQTKGQLPAACDALQAIDKDFPGHFAVAYDIGICAESRGDFAGAIEWYRRAAAARPSNRIDFDAGLARAQQLIDGRADRAEIARRR